MPRRSRNEQSDDLGRRASAPTKRTCASGGRRDRHNATQLWNELHAKGYQGSYPTLCRFLVAWRLAEPSAPIGISAAQPYTPRQATWLFLQQATALTPEESAYLQKLKADAHLAALHDLVQTFGRIIRDRDLPCLDVWLGAARESSFRELRGFAVHLQQDHAAVAAAVSLPWSNGQTEGQITRLKVLKRQMYLRQEVARAIVLMPEKGGERQTGPAVPSAVPYEVRREGNEPSNSPLTTYPRQQAEHQTVRGTVICQHQGGEGPGWTVWLTDANSR